MDSAVAITQMCSLAANRTANYGNSDTETEVYLRYGTWLWGIPVMEQNISNKMYDSGKKYIKQKIVLVKWN